ncbi:unnamed protein product [Caenorhabditis nigoni]
MSSVENPIVKLNVGGVQFQTLKSTLTKFDGMFKVMMETEIPVQRDENSCVFIDRSPKHFEKILNFMRDGHVALPESPEDVKEIQAEAQYYLLTGLVDLCSSKAKNEDNGILNSLPKRFRIIKNDVELFKVLAKPKKPVLIIQFCVYAFSAINKPVGVDYSRFLRTYDGKLDIYFKDLGFPSTNWLWSIHYQDMSHNSDEEEARQPYSRIPKLFESKLKDGIEYFFTVNDIDIGI